MLLQGSHDSGEVDQSMYDRTLLGENLKYFSASEEHWDWSVTKCLIVKAEVWRLGSIL